MFLFLIPSKHTRNGYKMKPRFMSDTHIYILCNSFFFIGVCFKKQNPVWWQLRGYPFGANLAKLKAMSRDGNLQRKLYFFIL